MDKAQQELRYLKYCVKAWTLKAIKQKFGELHSNESAVGGIGSPLPSLSPMPTRGSVLPNELDDLSTIMQRADVIEYMAAVNKAIEDKLLISSGPSARKVRLSIAGGSPYRTTSAKRNLQGVAKKLNMPTDGRKVAWDEQPVGSKRSMPVIKEEGDDGYLSEGRDYYGDQECMINTSLNSTKRRGRGRESILPSPRERETELDPTGAEKMVRELLEVTYHCMYESALMVIIFGNNQCVL
jgi:hypothetical protein